MSATANGTGNTGGIGIGTGNGVGSAACGDPGESVAARLEKLRDARVVVTGGAGLVGSRLVALLRRADAEVTVLDRLDAYPESAHTSLFGVDGLGAKTVVGDICDREAVRTVLDGADYVVHAAAYADVAACTRRPDIAFRANVQGTQVVLEEAAASTVRRLVLVSSAAVYGDGDPSVRGPQVFREDQRLLPVSVYANSKLWAEHQTRLLLGGPDTPEYAVLRYFSVYGDPQIPKPGSHSWMVAWLSMQARLGRPMRLNGGGVQVRDLVHVEDVAAATALALIEERMAGETVNVGTGVPTSVREVGELIAPHFPASRFVTTPLPQGDPLGGYAATAHSRELLRWQPRIDVRSGVERYVRWLSATPHAVPGWLAAGPAA
ncbi:NAD-dependent epimerase/dehydratase family protein [Streptomyces sp. GS7]|uniref:NAD-dependent epimerase/dehydratase family protein n=1 Tax=Streptomyces sp. GS7 TaxID=2692234 RepID=UPI001316044B|nr:NAD-dependent epimerase/dehydratase family protein [Streptomyces sp. GS7]QHC21225.1 NAD-dependent epimerase/dehydratase family protein [Streptomyces sp. GS7]